MGLQTERRRIAGQQEANVANCGLSAMRQVCEQESLQQRYTTMATFNSTRVVWGFICACMSLICKCITEVEFYAFCLCTAGLYHPCLAVQSITSAITTTRCNSCNYQAKGSNEHVGGNSLVPWWKIYSPTKFLSSATYTTLTPQSESRRIFHIYDVAHFCMHTGMHRSM